MVERRKYNKLDYTCLTEYLVFTDLYLSPLLKGEDVVVDEKVMIRSNYDDDAIEVHDIANELSTAEFQGENVKGVLLYFLNYEYIASAPIVDLLNLCKTKFRNAKIIFAIKKKPEYLMLDSIFCDEFILLERGLRDAEDFVNFIDFRLLGCHPQLTYSCSQHNILGYLKKRCQIPFIFQQDSENEENFVIDNGKDKLHFLFVDSFYSVYNNNQLSNEPFLKLSVEHLLGMYNFCHLFNIVDVLKKIRKYIKVVLILDELIFYDEAQTDTVSFVSNSSSYFFNVIKILDEFSETFEREKFKIQMAPNNSLVLNRCLKISLTCLGTFLKSGVQEQVVLDLVKLTFSYFKCFSKSPICSRMQSLAPDATVFDFEEFTHIHLQKNSSLYIKLCRLLFPFLAEAKDTDLKKPYLEVVPVSLIQCFHGIELKKFIEMLEKIIELNMPILPLSNGKFRVGTYLNVTVHFFTSFYLDHYSTFSSGETSVFFEALQRHAQEEDDKSKFCNSDFPKLISYEIPSHEHKYWMYKRRFVFSKYEKKVKELIDIVAEMVSFEKSEGICLIMINYRIDSVEKMGREMIEFNDKYYGYKSDRDYCFYNEDDLIAFIQFVKNLSEEDRSELIHFEINSFGLLRFDNYITISTSLFLKIKDKKKLMQIIKKLCALNCSTQDAVSVPEVKGYNKKILVYLELIAKYLNPRLKNLKFEDFQLNHFLCLPAWLMKVLQTELLCETLRLLRQNNVKTNATGTLCKTKIVTDRCELLIPKLAENVFPLKDFLQLLEKMEEINEAFYGFLMITDSHLSVFNCRQVLDPITAELTTKEVKQFFGLFEKFGVKHVAIENNICFSINRAVHLFSEHARKLNEDNFKRFLEICKFFYDEKCYDHWISLSKEYSSFEALKTEKFLQFTISDDNVKLYLELIRLLTPCLDTISDQTLLAYSWLELLPSHLLTHKSSLEKLLHILKRIKAYFEKICCDFFGIRVFSIYLPIKILLKLDTSDKIDTFIEFLFTITRRIQPGGQSPRRPSLKFGGRYSYDLKEVPENPCVAAQGIVSNFLDCIYEGDYRRLSVTIDSSENIMLGNYMWGNSKHICLVSYSFFTAAQIFESCVQLEDKDLMRSICGLPNRTNAIRLVGTLNPHLLCYQHDVICSENFKTLPTPLWKECYKNEETYEKAINIFNKLKQKEVPWIVQLNGLIQIGSTRIVVTTTDLLAFPHDPEKLDETIEDLKLLLDEIDNSYTVQLTCLDQIRHNELEEPKVDNTRTLSHKESVLLREELLKNDQKIGNIKIEPNGVFIVNDFLWIKAKKAIQSDVATLSNRIKKVFPNTKFQYGNQNEKIYVSLLHSSDQHLFEYCRSMCEFIQEQYPELRYKYLYEKNMFEFNGALSVHPRTFFHLQDIDRVVDFLKKLKRHKEEVDDLESDKEGLTAEAYSEKKKQLDSDETILFKELWFMKKEERLEFNIIKEKFYNKLSEILWAHKDGRLCSLVKDMNLKKPFKGVEDIQIRGEFIFQNGSALLFINIKKESGEIEYVYKKDEDFVEAVELADKLDEKFKCMNLFDFQSLVQIVDSYKKFKINIKNIIPKKLLQKPLHEQINWWLEEVQKEQDKPDRKHKFFNAIKGLHHWYKHEDSFKNVEEYYERMNQFFEMEKHKFEIYNQNGEFISREYENDMYIGYYGIAQDGSGRNYVASFWYKKTYKLKVIQEKNAEYLIITDTSFSSFKSTTQISLNEKIFVNFKVLKGLPALVNYVLTEKFPNVNSNAIRNVLLFIPEVTKNLGQSFKGKIKTEDDAGNLRQIETRLKARFTNANIILCYSHVTNREKLETIIQNSSCELVEIDESLMEGKSAIAVKNFVESKLNID